MQVFFVEMVFLENILFIGDYGRKVLVDQMVIDVHNTPNVLLSLEDVKVVY